MSSVPEKHGFLFGVPLRRTSARQDSTEARVALNLFHFPLVCGVFPAPYEMANSGGVIGIYRPSIHCCCLVLVHPNPTLPRRRLFQRTRFKRILMRTLLSCFARTPRCYCTRCGNTVDGANESLARDSPSVRCDIRAGDDNKGYCGMCKQVLSLGPMYPLNKPRMLKSLRIELHQASKMLVCYISDVQT